MECLFFMRHTMEAFRSLIIFVMRMYILKMDSNEDSQLTTLVAHNSLNVHVLFVYFEFWSSFPPKNIFPQSSRCNTVNSFEEFYQSLKDSVSRRKFFLNRIRTGMLVEFCRLKTWIWQKLKWSLWKLRILNISTQGPQTQISWDSNNHDQD